jgi:hypothetical protein
MIIVGFWWSVKMQHNVLALGTVADFEASHRLSAFLSRVLILDDCLFNYM